MHAFARAPSAAEGRAYLQKRIALFGRWGFALSVTAQIVSVLAGHPMEITVGWILNHAVTALMLVVWLLCRRGERSLPTLRVLDGLAAAGTALVVAVMGRFLAWELAPQLLVRVGGAAASPVELRLVDAYTTMMLILAGAVMFSFRAAVIPSPPWFTVVVTGVGGSPFVLVPTVVAPLRQGDQVVWQSLAATNSLDHAIWWAIVTATCGVIGHVVYGLRREVAAARHCGPYQLLEMLGEGGMGTVYRARHAGLARPTAVKLLSPQRLSDSAIRRFESEVQLTAQLTHPNTVTVFDFGRSDDGRLYYAMELLEGLTLDEVVERDGPQPAARVVRVLAQIAGALEEAHERGLIHRDVKPSNIMLTRRGNDLDSATLLDFGLAKALAASSTLTGAGCIIGTPGYLAPERISDGATETPALDVYALGAVGYFLLTGTEVFSGPSLVEVCAQHLYRAPPRPSDTIAAVPPWLDEIVLDCLAKEPQARPSASTLRRRLAAVPLEHPWSDADTAAAAAQPALSTATAAPAAAP